KRELYASNCSRHSWVMTTTLYPGRFRAAPDRSERMGRTLKRIARVDELDEQLMDRLGRGFHEKDELGSRLAKAMRKRKGEPDAVHPRQCSEACGLGSTGQSEREGAAPVLVKYLEALEATSDRVDWDRIAKAQKVYLKFGQNASDV